MYSKITIKGYPVHPALVAFPITFYTVAFFGFFIIEFFNANAFLYKVAVYSNYAGVITALIAAVPGFLDWFLGIPKQTAAKQRGFLHMTLNITSLLLFAINAGFVWGTQEDPPISVGTSVILTGLGFIFTGIAGFHGWNLVAQHKVGVQLTIEQERKEHEEELRRSA
jgi:uncharacterized membrane protein